MKIDSPVQLPSLKTGRWRVRNWVKSMAQALGRPIPSSALSPPHEGESTRTATSESGAQATL
jgi:hypothetical protein